MLAGVEINGFQSAMRGTCDHNQTKDFEHTPRAARTRPPGAVCHENEIFQRATSFDREKIFVWIVASISFGHVNEKPTTLVFANYHLVLQPVLGPAGDRCDKEFSCTIFLHVELGC